MIAAAPQHLPGVLHSLEPTLNQFGYLAVVGLVLIGEFELDDAATGRFRTSSQIEFAAPDLDWLNKGVFIRVAGRGPAQHDLRDVRDHWWI